MDWLESPEEGMKPFELVRKFEDIRSRLEDNRLEGFQPLGTTFKVA